MLVGSCLIFGEVGMMENEVVCKCKDRVELRPGVQFEHVATHVNIGDRTMIMRPMRHCKMMNAEISQG